MTLEPILGHQEGSNVQDKHNRKTVFKNLFLENFIATVCDSRNKHTHIKFQTVTPTQNVVNKKYSSKHNS